MLFPLLLVDLEDAVEFGFACFFLHLCKLFCPILLHKVVFIKVKIVLGLLLQLLLIHELLVVVLLRVGEQLRSFLP